jgi:hypothetical protein
MAKRRGSSGDEVSLFPFLSILACLIGALVAIIVVLVVAQTEKMEGRTPEDIQMAQEVLNIKKELEKRDEQKANLDEKVAALKKIQEEVEDLKVRFAKLRKLLDSSKEVKQQNMEISQQLQKELDDLLLEMDGLKRQQELSKKEIALLMAELEKRKIPEDKKPPPVQVQPSGSGMGEETKVYFVEASSGSLKVLKPWGDEDYRLSAQPDVVVGDHAYNHFLLELQKDKNSLILFLVRDDGYGAYNNGAGRAESDYGIRVGKLPIPGRGDLQLDLFEKFRGKVPPPPPPPSSAPSGTPPTTPPGAPPPAK